MNYSSQISRRHHFVPQFYLRNWYDQDGQGFWLYERNAKGRLILKRRPAKSVAYMENLYSLNPKGVIFSQPRVSGRLEEDFFSKIDSAASIVHKKILSEGVAAISLEDKGIWCLFLNSLIERSPERIANVIQDVLKDKMMPGIQRHFASLRGRGTLEEFELEAFIKNMLLTVLPGKIFDQEFVDYLARLQWVTFDLSDGPDHFFATDSPVLLNGGGHEAPVYFLSIALSPKRLLVIHGMDFESDFLKNLVIIHNVKLAERAQRHLISSQRLVSSLFVKYDRIANEFFKMPR